jgi:hypothetical protein
MMKNPLLCLTAAVSLVALTSVAQAPSAYDGSWGLAGLCLLTLRPRRALHYFISPDRKDRGSIGKAVLLAIGIAYRSKGIVRGRPTRSR